MDSVTIGERIALLRKKNGYTQQQLADILSISSKTVSRWETGEGFPEISIIPNLTKTLGVSIDQLLEDTNNEYWEKQYKNTLSEENKNKSAYITLLVTIKCIFIYQLSLLIIALIESYVFSTDLCLLWIVTSGIKALQLSSAVGCFFLAYKSINKFENNMLNTFLNLPLICICFCIICEICKKLFFYICLSKFAATNMYFNEKTALDYYSLGAIIVELFAIATIAILIIFCLKNKKIFLICILVSIISIFIGFLILNSNYFNSYILDNILIKIYECILLITIIFNMRLKLGKD